MYYDPIMCMLVEDKAKVNDKAIRACDAIYKFQTVNDIDGIDFSDIIKKAAKNSTSSISVTFDGKNKYTVNATVKNEVSFKMAIENFGFFDKWL